MRKEPNHIHIHEGFLNSICNLGTKGQLHTRNRAPVTIALQALLLVEKAEPVQVRFTLCLREQQSM